MRIRFSVYNEDRESGNVEFVDSLLVYTDWTVQQIDEHIALYDGFHSNLIIGEHLSFLNYYCFNDSVDELIAKIKTIPRTSQELPRLRMPCVFRVSEFDPSHVDIPEYPNNNQCFLYNLERYECGASGFEAAVYWASTHPLEMMFIGGIIYDFTKWLFTKVLNFLGIKKTSTAMCPVLLNTKKLYRNFSKATNIETEDCQITKFNRLRVGVFHVQMQTITGRKFKLKSTANGEIESIEEIT